MGRPNTHRAAPSDARTRRFPTDAFRAGFAATGEGRPGEILLLWE